MVTLWNFFLSKGESLAIHKFVKYEQMWFYKWIARFLRSERVTILKATVSGFAELEKLTIHSRCSLEGNAFFFFSVIAVIDEGSKIVTHQVTMTHWRLTQIQPMRSYNSVTEMNIGYSWNSSSQYTTVFESSAGNFEHENAMISEKPDQLNGNHPFQRTIYRPHSSLLRICVTNRLVKATAHRRWSSTTISIHMTCPTCIRQQKDKELD